MAARVAARLVQRRFRSSGGKVLGEEEKAAENVYIKVSSIPHHLNPPPSSCAARARPWVFGLERDFSNARVYDGSTSSAFGGGGGRAAVPLPPSTVHRVRISLVHLKINV
jgi:hypothetical protein